MDQIKIGKYIAVKRKELGLTQAQLGEKLGKSDKSVSKWERGVCLPDVSVYMELCEILGISINEFIAGEDLTEEKIISQSEKNIIEITTESKKKRGRMQKLFIACTLIYCLIVYCMFVQDQVKKHNYIEAIEKENMLTLVSETISESDNVYLYQYDFNESFEKVTVYLTEYINERQVEKTKLIAKKYKDVQREDMLILIPDFERNKFRVAFTNEEGNVSSDISIESRSQLIASACELDGNQTLSKGDEVKLASFQFEAGYMYLISVYFQ